MRAVLGTLSAVLVVLLPASVARASDLRFFEDAALHAVQFVDEEGWAVGDEGVIWHTIDGGREWERQPTGTRASLRALFFLNPYLGWVVGREEQAHDGGSVGVLLFTRDGGQTWQRLLTNSLPGLNRVRFTDQKTGFVLGDGTDQFPTGVFRTTDGGRGWQPVPGPRSPSWLDGDFQDGQTGALAGVWSRLATMRQGSFAAADVDTLGGRSLRGLRLLENRALAVGQGGLILTSRSNGASWGYADLKLPADVLAGWDFHAIDSVGDDVWVAGRPGSVVLHSPDRGGSWKVLRTGQPLPLNGIFFIDSKRGWAVGELGCILATLDGGATWKVQRRGGQRASVLLVHARATEVPVETVAALGADEGHLAVGLRVTAPDPGSAALDQAAALPRFTASLRRSGGAAGEMLWQFPVPQHLANADKRDLVEHWDKAQGKRAAHELLRQMVLALRMWRPDVILTDHPDIQVSGPPGGALVAEALHLAFAQAADAKAFPEQIETLGLETWSASKLYALWDKRDNAQVVMDGNEISSRLEASPREFAAPAASLLSGTAETLPAQRCYRLLDSRLNGAANQRRLMDGVPLAADGVARRAMPADSEIAPETEKALRARRNFQTLVERPATALSDPGKILSQLGPVLAGLPADQGAAAAFAVANQYVRTGQWLLAQETFLALVDRYPAHPLAADAYRWLVRHNGSSEARRRYELGQFVRVNHTSVSAPEVPQVPFELPPLEPATQPGIRAVHVPVPADKKTANSDSRPPLPSGDRQRPWKGTEPVQHGQLSYLSNQGEIRQWYKGSLEIGKRLEGLGPLFGADPSVQFCLQAARRHLGDFQAAQEWYQHYKDLNIAGPWRAAAAAELWLSNRSGLPPKSVMPCRQTATRPFLDGNFEDACWQGLKPVVLGNAVGDTVKEYQTETRFAYDQDFLYIALRCTHPPEGYVPTAKVRPRDADLRSHDRVSILLDLDRDYCTCFHLQVDQRGCVCEDCWGDRSWNPRWFVAVRSNQTGWNIEAAIPLRELTGDRVTLNTAWACNVVRVLPRRGVQAWSLPADAEPRPEGMGLLIFQEDPTEAAVRPAAAQAPAVP